MPEPATQAGQALLNDPIDGYPANLPEPEVVIWRDTLTEKILAIEAEAATEQKRIDNNELFRRGVETGEAYEAVIAATAAEAVKPWREAAQDPQNHAYGCAFSESHLHDEPCTCWLRPLLLAEDGK